MKAKKSLMITVLITVLAIAAVFGGIYMSRNRNKTEKTVSQESAKDQLKNLYDEMDVYKAEKIASPIEYNETVDEASELPDISTCPVPVNPTDGLVVEIYSSPEKSGSGVDGWLCEMAEDFNKSMSNGKVRIRTVNSGQAVDYIASGKAVPDAVTPSAMFWTTMMDAKGVQTEVIADRLVGNTAGIVLTKDKYQEVVDEYGAADLKAIYEAVDDGKLIIGYTNPYASTGGMNNLITTLLRYDTKDPLSDKAADGFAKFQKNIPFVALTTMQMREAAAKGSFDGFILEYQSYLKANLDKDHKFIPYGYRHDNPLVAIGTLTEERKAVLQAFADFCLTEEAQKRATEYGFNQNEDYTCEYPDLDGETLLKAQSLYKKNKNAGKKVVSVFVTDISGSMGQDRRLIRLQESLLNAMQYINPENRIGLVSYSSDVTIELPIAEFDMKQQTYFKGAVENLQAIGGTAMFDGIIVAAKMLVDEMEIDPEIQPEIYVLSDGETSSGHSLHEIEHILESLRIPVYTIGYGVESEALEKVSAISEAETIDANTDDIVYQMKMLFNANM